MKKKNVTKSALLASILAMVLCVTMLVGTTFAWFTDTASAKVNQIKSGNLDVTLEYATAWDTATGEPTAWADATQPGSTLSFIRTDANNNKQATDVLWEPGCTYNLPELRVSNNGNLRLKYKVVISGAAGYTQLLDVIDFKASVDGAEQRAVNVKDGGAIVTDVKLAAKSGETAPSNVIKISGTMQTTAGNEYQNRTVTGITVTVYATQDTGEYDSNGNTYDEKAEYPQYPDGVTKDTFTDNNVIVDANGNYYSSFESALESVASNGGTLYMKENATVDFPTHLNVTKDITIYGNGADFSGKDISIGIYAAPENEVTNIKIYNAKNLVIWGQPVGERADVWNIEMVNCENNGSNFIMYRGSETGKAQINATLTNCKATGFSDSIIHTTADGSITLKNCEFSDNCAPVNIAHKQSGTMTVTVKDCTFNNCGKVDESNDYFAPARFVNNSSTGKLEVTLTNNTFKGTIGTNGDILLGDYRTGKESHALTANITTASPVMVKSSFDAAYSYNGGTITLNN